MNPYDFPLLFSLQENPQSPIYHLNKPMRTNVFSNALKKSIHHYESNYYHNNQTIPVTSTYSCPGTQSGTVESWHVPNNCICNNNNNKNNNNDQKKKKDHNHNDDSDINNDNQNNQNKRETCDVIFKENNDPIDSKKHNKNQHQQQQLPLQQQQSKQESEYSRLFSIVKQGIVYATSQKAFGIDKSTLRRGSKFFLLMVMVMMIKALLSASD
jgi:hypothetical protein